MYLGIDLNKINIQCKREWKGSFKMGINSINLDGNSLSIKDIVNVARHRYQIVLDPKASILVQDCAKAVQSWVDAGRVVYGITTGFGDLASVVIPADKSRLLQKNLLLSHACGVGAPLPEDVVRAIMLLRINTLTRGHSGISLETLTQLINFLNLGIHPVIPSQGSVGASGDLCPLSHLAITLMGEGEVIYNGKRMPAIDAIKQNNLKPIELKPKEGLSLNNGTTVMAAMAALAVYDGENLKKMIDIVGALSCEALRAVPYAFDSRTHKLRPHKGQIQVAENISRLIAGSEIVAKYQKERVQDAYSLRCMPQVHGASRDALEYVREKIEIELNSVTDNPILFPDDGDVISGGNFHGQPLALAMDFWGIAISEMGSISERRSARLVDHKLSGLPPFLAVDSGINSGFMIPQYTAASLASENKVLAHPSCVDSIPTSANQEDHVSMGGYSARKALQILSNVQSIVGIELLLAAQGADFHKPLNLGMGTQAALKHIRKNVPFLEKDTFLYPIMQEAISLASGEELIMQVESAVGELK